MLLTECAIFPGGQIRRRLLSILDELEFNQAYPKTCKWKFFDGPMLEQVFKSCEEKALSGVTVINIQELHRVLVSELNELQGAAAVGQRSLIVEVHFIKLIIEK